MGDLSPNFDTREFRCRHCGALRGPDVSLVATLQRMRTAKKRPLIVVSGYRCPEHNARVGGASRSRHLYGDAADVPAGYATADEWRRAGATGIGIRDGQVVHVDVRRHPVTFWE